MFQSFEAQGTVAQEWTPSLKSLILVLMRNGATAIPEEGVPSEGVVSFQSCTYERRSYHGESFKNVRLC